MDKIYKYFVVICLLFLVGIKIKSASYCGCKEMRPCYEKMLDTLKDKEEESCVEDASVGISTVMIFLKAVKQFCPDIIKIENSSASYEGRQLYEVVLGNTTEESTKPVIIIEAGQQAGVEPVGLALYIIEQLIACQENNEMLQKVKWVVMPCTNPDGMEYARFVRLEWTKNLKPADDKLSIGVDISRNFDSQWGSCEKVESGFSPEYPGLAPATENETIFIKNVLTKYKSEAKAYLSIRRDGHALLYPYGYGNNDLPATAQITKVATEMASRVSQRAGAIQPFINSSIYSVNGKGHCGHSVDYAYDIGIPLSYEMRVFLGAHNRVMSMFQTLPKGYEASLRAGYFSGIRELYNIISNDKKFGRMF